MHEHASQWYESQASYAPKVYLTANLTICFWSSLITTTTHLGKYDVHLYIHLMQLVNDNPSTAHSSSQLSDMKKPIQLHSLVRKAETLSSTVVVVVALGF